MSNFIDLTGKQFGKLKVLYRYKGNDKTKGHTYWVCECQCEDKTIKIVDGCKLKSGETMSCGCEKIKRISKLNAKGPNNYEIEEGVAIGHNGENSFVVDIEDYNKIKNYRWHLDHCKYWVSDVIINGKKKRVFLHKFILNSPSDEVIDHADRDKSNNRKSNLRACSRQENNYNKGCYKDSGYIGVRLRKDTNKWSACLQINKKVIHLGCFDTEEEALIARLKAEKKYFKEFAPQRDLFLKYNI